MSRYNSIQMTSCIDCGKTYASSGGLRCGDCLGPEIPRQWQLIKLVDDQWINILHDHGNEEIRKILESIAALHNGRAPVHYDQITNTWWSLK